MHLLPLTAPWLLGTLFLLLDGRRKSVATSAAVIAAAVLALDLGILVSMTTGGTTHWEVVTGSWPRGVGIRLYVDRAALFFGAITAGVLATVLFHESRAIVRSRLFPGLILLLLAGLHGTFFTGDLFNFYVFFELSIVASFALATYGYGRAEMRGALVYVSVNLLGSVLFLIGVATVYHSAGTLDFEQMAKHVTATDNSLALSAALVFAALSLKLGLFPFHGWVPVLYSHAKPAVAAALSGALVNVGAYGLLRIGYFALETAREEGSTALWIWGMVAGIYGAVVAVNRSRPAELAAYASVVHAGYIVLALGIGSVHGIAALLLTALSGSIDKSMMFLSLDAEGATRSSTALIGASSLAGLPITLGFLSKVQLFRATAAAPSGWIVTGGLLLSAVLIIAAAFRFWHLTRFGRPATHSPSPRPVVLLGVATIGLGILAEPVVTLTWTIAREISGGG